MGKSHEEKVKETQPSVTVTQLKIIVLIICSFRISRELTLSEMGNALIMAHKKSPHLQSMQYLNKIIQAKMLGEIDDFILPYDNS